MTPVLVEVGTRIEHTGYQTCAHETSICMSVFFPPENTYNAGFMKLYMCLVVLVKKCQS